VYASTVIETGNYRYRYHIQLAVPADRNLTAYCFFFIYWQNPDQKTKIITKRDETGYGRKD
jgi:hypothetical protein